MQKTSIKVVKVVVVIIFIYALVLLIATPFTLKAQGFWGYFFVIEEEWGAVTISVSGDKEDIVETGIKCRLSSIDFTKIAQHYYRGLQSYYIDSNPEEHKMQAANDLLILGKALVGYRIADGEKWLIKTGNDREQLFQEAANSIAKDVIQPRDAGYIVTQKEQIEKDYMNSPKIKNIYDELGVEIVSFSMPVARYTDDMIITMTKAKEHEIVAQSRNKAADFDVKRINKKTAAIIKRADELAKKMLTEYGVKNEALVAQVVSRVIESVTQFGFQDVLTKNKPNLVVMHGMGAKNTPDINLPVNNK